MCNFSEQSIIVVKFVITTPDRANFHKFFVFLPIVTAREST